MAKCDVCGKSTLLPEKFGEINICKICFMKINGTFWKHQYDRYEDVEKHRCKALESAHKHNFPQSTISAINFFFMSQIQSMIPCDCCHHPVQHRQSLGKTNICKDCFDKINTFAWRENDYEDNNEVEDNRKKVLKIAHKNSFPSVVINDINSHFDKKIQPGLLYVINGGKGQKLKVFVDHCILITSNRFNLEQTSVEYTKALKRNQSHLATNTRRSLTKSLLLGDVVGITMATSQAIGTAARQQENTRFKVITGEYRINYQVFSDVDYQKAEETELGFIRFINNRARNSSSECVVFFFERDNTKLDKAFQAICNGIDNVLAPNTQASISPGYIPQNSPPVASISTISVADEILKFKQLLDMGALTQEEFDTKKKELLSR